jgi:site-specific recombinase XerD
VLQRALRTLAHTTAATCIDLTDDDIHRFLDGHLPRCSCPPPVRRCRHEARAALRHLLALLRDAGIIVKCHVSNAVEEELRRFDEHMHHVKGLAQNTRAPRLRILRRFLLQRSCSAPGELTPLNPADLRRFIEQQLQRWSPASAGNLVGALRCYLRFRALCGEQVTHLLPVIASPANWRLAPLPETLSSSDVDRLLASFGPEVPHRLRAYAMARCVVDLGLRAQEVVGLTLDDVDWRAGTIRIGQNKSRRIDVLPLPHATGKAIASYLRLERPRTTNRRVFVRHVAPIDEPIGPGVVRRAIHEAYRRSGIAHTRVHVLRHTLAGRLLDRGGTLKEVADMLRHRDLDTSLIYTKIDTARLTAVALPWPGSAV